VRRRLFPLLALLLPLVVLGGLELLLRAGGYGERTRLFVPHQVGATGPADRWLVASSRVAERWFSFRGDLPTPLPEPFLSAKPAAGLRIFVLGESAAAGFPYGLNGAFSLVVRDALQDVLPRDTVEVVNLGTAAINSFAWLDMVDELLAQRPDAVFIYGGHNEYYGAFGAASSQGLRAPRGVIRAWLGLQRLRVVLWTRNATLRLAQAFRSEPEVLVPGADLALMRRMVRQEVIPLGGETYRRGLADFEANLSAMVAQFTAAGVPVFVASVPSNLRDQPPFRSVADLGLPAAMAVYEAAAEAFVAGDTAGAAPLFARARDLDGLRFRAPSDLSAIVRSVVAATGATYVPVAEGFSAAARGGVPGNELFTEHVHPSVAGTVILARLFYEAVAATGFLGREAEPARLAGWAAYQERMALSEFDQRLAWHQVRQLKSRWPFSEQMNVRAYPWVYQRQGVADSLAFEVALGVLGWTDAKVTVATAARAAGNLAGAAAEFVGVARSDASNPAPRIALGEIRLAQGDSAGARTVLELAHEMGGARFTALPLGRLAVAREDYGAALRYLEQALPLTEDPSALLLELSRVAVLARDLPRAVRYADQLYGQKPNYPGLAEWRGMLATLRP